ncbi:hypothetical protein Tco_1105286 [Tanacetum coccineum]
MFPRLASNEWMSLRMARLWWRILVVVEVVAIVVEVVVVVEENYIGEVDEDDEFEACDTPRSQMHNNILASGSKERSPMLAPDLVTLAVTAEGDNQGQPQVVRQETYINTTPENRNAKEIVGCLKRFATLARPKTNRMSRQNLLPEVNEIRAERIAKNANPLALVAATQYYPDDYTQSPKPYKTHAHSSRQTPSTRTHATTRNKGKEIVKPPSPQSESASEEDSEEEGSERQANAKKFSTHCKTLQEYLQTYQQQPQNFIKHQKQKDGYFSQN